MHKIIMTDLNKLEAENDGNFPDIFQDNSTVSTSTHVSVLFRNQKAVLLKKISEHKCIVGCVAWLTDFEILKALAAVDPVAIVVQKEDFLRPDLGAKNGWKNILRKHYDAIKNSSGRMEWPGLMSKLSFAFDPTMHGIRCVGNHNAQRVPAFPRMHNKFLVFCTEKKEPKEVWTGSFNLTRNATASLENAVLISNPNIALAYYNEFCQIYALSEPLDWQSTWCAPEFRIGS